MKRRRPVATKAPAIVRALISKQRAPEIARQIAADATEVRRFIRENLLLGRMSLEAGKSETAWQSIFQGLYIAGIAVEAEGMTHVMRVIGGAANPLDAIKARLDAGADHILTGADSATLSAATGKVLDILDELPDATLVLAHQLLTQAKAVQAGKTERIAGRAA